MPAAARADWYFDFISPYSYLQSERLESLPFAVRPRPVLFAGLLQHWGHKGPAEMPSKRVFTYRQVVWIARRDGIALRFPPRHPFNPIKVLRLAIALGCELAAIHAIFRHIWAEGGEVETDAGFAALCEKLGVADGGSRRSRSRTRCAPMGRPPSRPASSACPRSPSTGASSGATTRPRWPATSTAIPPPSSPARWLASARSPWAPPGNDRGQAPIAFLK